MVKKKQVIQSGAWQMLNVGIKVFSQFAYYGVMARLLEKSEMGIFALLIAFMNFGNMMGDGGMGDALVQRKEVEKKHLNAAFYSSLLLGLILYFAIFFSASFWADFYDEPELTHSLRIFCVTFLFAAICSASYAQLQSRFAFKRLFIADGGTLLLSNVFGIVLAYYGGGYMSLVWSHIVYYGLRMLLLLYYQPVPIKLGFERRHWKDLIGYGTGLTLIRLNNYIVNSGIILEVGKLVTTAALAVFERSFRIMNIPQRFIYDMVQRVMMPAMVKKSDGKKGTFIVFSKTLSLILTILMPLTVFLILLSEPVVLILLGKKWLDAVPLLQIFFLNLPLRTAASLGDTLMRVHGLIRLNLIRKVQNSAIILVLIYLGSFYGLEGISWGVLASTVISYIMMIAIIRKRIFPDDWKKLVFKPYYNGLMLSVFFALPCFLAYLGIHTFIKDAIIAFLVVCSIAGVAGLYLFVKKPKLLGSDIAYIQPDLLGMFKKGGKKKQKKAGQLNKAENKAENEAEITEL